MAERSGWSKTEAAEALRELSFAHLSTEDENLKTTLAVIEAGVIKH
ncbi:hypothetical protein V7799_01125 [Rhizobium laguerreae]